MIWRCRFDSSTTSKAAMPSVPTPAAARYISAGDPRPPAPMTRTLAFFRRFCPSIATSGMIRWREYRRISSTDRSAAGSTSGGRDIQHLLVPNCGSAASIVSTEEDRCTFRDADPTGSAGQVRLHGRQHRPDDGLGRRAEHRGLGLGELLGA